MARYPHSLVLVLVLGIVTGGCGPWTTESTTTVVDLTQIEPAPEDRSLTIEEYAAAGLPPHDRPWGGDDMRRALEVLTALRQEQPGSLPRHDSPRSGEIFRRLVAADNLDRPGDPSLSLDKRVVDFDVYLQASDGIYWLYLDANIDEVGNAEMIRLLGATLDHWSTKVDLEGELLEALEPGDPSIADHLAQVPAMRKMLSFAVTQALSEVVYSHYYTLDERRRLMEILLRTGPTLFPELPVDEMDTVHERLRVLTEMSMMEELRPELIEIRDLFGECRQRPSKLQFES